MAGNEPSRERTKYLKRKQTILKKIWELSTFCDVEVHVKFVHALETIIIDSTDGANWPSEDEMEETEDRPVNRYDLESLGQYLRDKEAEAFAVEQDEIQLPEPPRLRRFW